MKVKSYLLEISLCFSVMWSMFSIYVVVLSIYKKATLNFSRFLKGSGHKRKELVCGVTCNYTRIQLAPMHQLQSFRSQLDEASL